MQRNPRLASLAVIVAACFAAAPSQAVEPARILAQSKKHTPTPPWPAGDELGMANTLGAGTMARCAWHMAQREAKSYELSYIRSATMPLSAFSGPYVTKPKPTASIPGTAHAFNLESFA